MEDYIIEISKYYFKGVLDNEVIQKVLSKKEEKFPIQEKVVKELDDLKEFILEMSKLNFPLNSIKESVDSFIRDSEYLQKTPNLNIDIEDILEDSLIEKTENIENNEIDNEITENRELEVIDNEKIEIIPNVIIDKNFEANSFFEVICNLYLETFVNLGNLVFQETDFDSIANGNFENKIKNHIQSLKNKLINLIPINDIDIHLFDSNFYDYLNRMNNITQIAREERGNISSNLSELKTLQKLSRNSGSSFFVGNLYAMGAFAAFKGIKSICNSVSDSNERNRLKSSMESNFMKQFYDYMEENLQSDLLSTMSIIVNTFSRFLSLHSPFRFSRIMLIPIMHRRNSATYLETASMYWRIVPPQIYPSVGISAWNPPKYSPATSPVFTGCILVFKPLHTETAKASIDRPTATSNRSSSPIGITSFTGSCLCPLYNPFSCFLLFLHHFVVMAFLS